MADEQQQQHLPRQPAPSFDRLENFNFLLSRHDPALAKSRHYSFDAESTGLAPPPPLNNSVSMDYDQTEGMGGLSVSSYESLEDERSSLDLRGYPYGESELFFFFFFPFLFCYDFKCCIFCAIALGYGSFRAVREIDGSIRACAEAIRSV